MSSRDQSRAALAHDHVAAVAAGSEAARKYASIVHKMPSLLQTAGLCQALHFARSRSSNDQKLIVEHLAAQLKRVNPSITSGDVLLARARQASLEEYLELTDEAMACAAWYRRMVQGILKIEASADEGDR